MIKITSKHKDGSVIVTEVSAPKPKKKVKKDANKANKGKEE